MPKCANCYFEENCADANSPSAAGCDDFVTPEEAHALGYDDEFEEEDCMDDELDDDQYYPEEY